MVRRATRLFIPRSVGRILTDLVVAPIFSVFFFSNAFMPFNVEFSARRGSLRRGENHPAKCELFMPPSDALIDPSSVARRLVVGVC